MNLKCVYQMAVILYRPLCIMHSSRLSLSKASIHGLGAAYHFFSLFHVISVGVLWRSWCYCVIYHIARYRSYDGRYPDPETYSAY